MICLWIWTGIVLQVSMFCSPDYHPTSLEHTFTSSEFQVVCNILPVAGINSVLTNIFLFRFNFYNNWKHLFLLPVLSFIKISQQATSICIRKYVPQISEWGGAWVVQIITVCIFLLQTIIKIVILFRGICLLHPFCGALEYRS